MTWLANVYRAVHRASHGNIGPRQADDLELWEIAVLIGADGHSDRRDDQYAHLRARVLARAEGRPEPTFNEEPADTASLELLMALGGSSVS